MKFFRIALFCIIVFVIVVSAKKKAKPVSALIKAMLKTLKAPQKQCDEIDAIFDDCNNMTTFCTRAFGNCQTHGNLPQCQNLVATFTQNTQAIQDYCNSGKKTCQAFSTYVNNAGANVCDFPKQTQKLWGKLNSADKTAMKAYYTFITQGK